jgi:hypothetical protein
MEGGFHFFILKLSLQLRFWKMGMLLIRATNDHLDFISHECSRLQRDSTVNVTGGTSRFKTMREKNK